MAKPSTLKNLGPESDRMLQDCGIETADEVRQLGAAMTYKILKHRFGDHVNRIWLYALEGALTDRHWNSFSPEENARLTASVEDELTIGGEKTPT
ncbi:MAG: TfoX/Sxy family DNA transformation protein [Bacteroidota bacterium]